MNHVVNALNHQLKGLGQLLQKQTEVLFEALAPLKKLPELVKAQTKSVQKGLYDNIRAQILIAIAQQKGNLGSKQCQVKEEIDLVKRLQERGEQDALNISKSKRVQVEKVGVDFQQAINRLDAPVLDLTRKVYEGSIHMPLVDGVMPMWQLTGAAGPGSRECRKLVFNGVQQEVLDALAHCRSLFGELQKAAGDLAHADDLPETIDIPVFAVEYEVEGRREVQVVAAPRVGEQGLESAIPWLQNKVDGNAARIFAAMAEEKSFVPVSGFTDVVDAFSEGDFSFN